MASTVERLTGLGVSRKTAPGYHADGGGLYLQIIARGSKSLVLRYSIGKRAREMGIGSCADFSLAEARVRAKAARQLLADGIDPIERRREAAQAAAAVARRAADAMTFGAAADRYIAAHEAGWKNAKHAYQWHQTIDAYAKPLLGHDRSPRSTPISWSGCSSRSGRRRPRRRRGCAAGWRRSSTWPRH